MKDALTNVDVYVLSRELRPRRFSKIVRISGGHKVKLVGAPDLLVLPPLLIPTSYVVPADRPDNLSVISRKRLGNRRVTAFEQLQFDRILRIGTEDGSIILELFGSGNVILTDADGVIVYALHERDWRDRSIRKGLNYVPPPAPRVHPTMSFDEFAAIFTARDAVRSLVRAGLPPVYAEEVCHVAGVQKDLPVADLQSGAVESLYSAFMDLVSRMNQPDPVVVRRADSGEVVDVLPFPISRYSSDDYVFEHHETLSEALDVLTPALVSTSEGTESRQEPERGMVSLWKRQRDEAVRELSELEAMLNHAYEHSAAILSAMESAKRGQKPADRIGPFVLRRWDGREVVYEFTPRP